MSLNNPQYVKVNGKLYKINTDFRVALECNDIVADENIGEYETVLAILYKLFGEDGLTCENQAKLVELAVRYLSLGNNENSVKIDSQSNFELDFKKCKGLIESSFKYDYGYNPYELDYLHWYTFYNDLQNLSTSEFGTCCPLNRIASILNQDASKIKETKDRNNIVMLQQELKQKYYVSNNHNRVELTDEQIQSAKAFYEELGYEIKD
jgi:hypothetical protein